MRFIAEGQRPSDEVSVALETFDEGVYIKVAGQTVAWIKNDGTLELNHILDDSYVKIEKIGSYNWIKVVR